jgi:hypothetical protein
MGKYVSGRGVSVAVNEIFVHMDTHLSNTWMSSSAVARISRFFIGLIPVKTQGQSNIVYVRILCS